LKKIYEKMLSKLSITVARSAPLRATTVGTALEHENIAISLASHYFPVSRSAPLRAIFFISVTLPNVPWTCLPSPFRSISIPLRSVLR